MDKEKILEKARRENRDEGQEAIYNLSNKWSSIFAVLVCAFVMIVNQVRGVENIVPQMIIAAVVAGEGVGEYIGTHKKAALVWAIVGVAALITWLYMFVTGDVQ